MSTPLENLLTEVRACRVCEAFLPLGPRPIIRVSSTARILVIGQAPGRKVHETGIPWNDPSGDRLRDWMGLSREEFYDERHIAVVGMGFCYPGKMPSKTTKSRGDAPPRPECAPLWHERILAELPHVELMLLIGSYAHDRYLGSWKSNSLAQTVARWNECGPRVLPLVHPSPRNRRWLQLNPWFEAEVVPELRRRVAKILSPVNESL